MVARDEVPVVGELAFDQPGGEPAATGLERRLALPQPEVDRVRRGQQPGQLGQCTRRQQHALALGQHRRTDQVADGQPVRIGGHQAQPTGLGSDQDAGQNRPRVVRRGGRDHLSQRLGQRLRVHRQRIAGRLGHTGEVIGGDQPQRELRPPGADLGGVVDDLDLDRTRLERPHDVVEQPGRDHRHPVPRAGHRHGHRDRQLEVGAAEEQLVALQLRPDAGQHGKRPTRAHGASCGGQRVDEDVPFASELHPAVPSRSRSENRCVFG